MTPSLYDDLLRRNLRVSRLLLAGAVLVLSAAAWAGSVLLLGADMATRPSVALLALLFAAAAGSGLTYFFYRMGPRMALRSAGARPLSRQEAPELHRLLDEVCAHAGLPTPPKLYLVEDPAPNAFATGLSASDAHVAVTIGLVERLPRYELRAVLAHEVAHIVNDDIRTVTVAVATAGVVALIADIALDSLFMRGGRRPADGGPGVVLLLFSLLALLLAPLAARLIRFAVSRQREYLADATAAEMLRDPQSMVDALRRLEQDSTPLQRFETANAHLWLEEPNRISGKGLQARIARRFSTHPPLQQRVQRLGQLGGGIVDVTRPLPPHGPPAYPPFVA